MSNAVKKTTAIRIKKYLKKFQYFLEVQSILFDLFLCLAEALIGAIKKKYRQGNDNNQRKNY
jgi:hypothetical protein